MSDISHSLKDAKAALDKLGLKVTLSKDMAELQVFPLWRGPLEYEAKFGN